MRRFLALALLFGLVSPALRAQDLDPFQPNAGDFLGVNLDALAKTASDLYHAQKYEGACKAYLAVLRYNVRDAGNIYDLACCYGLLGKADLATKYLQRAIMAGFSDAEHVKNDPDFNKVRKDPAFAAAVDAMADEVKKRDEGLGELVYFDAPTFLKCRVHLPAGYDPKKPYTLLVGLHGFGDTADHFTRLWRWIGDANIIFAVPETQYPFPIGNQTGYTWTLDGPGTDQVGKRARELTEEYIVRVTKALKAKYKVSRTYLFGFSQGCMMTYCVGIRNSGLYEGIIAFGGWLDTDWLGSAVEKAKRLRVFIAQGNKGPVVKPENATKARDALVKNGNEVKYFEFDGVHQVPEAAVRAALDWMRR